MLTTAQRTRGPCACSGIQYALILLSLTQMTHEKRPTVACSVPCDMYLLSCTINHPNSARRNAAKEEQSCQRETRLERLQLHEEGHKYDAKECDKCNSKLLCLIRLLFGEILLEI